MPSYKIKVKETKPEWWELAQKNLDQGDEINKSYQGELDGDGGYLCISNKKILFVNEQGFFRKKYDLILDLPLEKIKISNEGKYKLDIINIEGKRRHFKTYSTPVSFIEKNLITD